ncbi:MAG: hypothetical protein JWO40_555 [Candidatus Doudnabacteria bacterium]|nr:hypothetical protein [Candidatus Doudnabacteria bacterium]
MTTLKIENGSLEIIIEGFDKVWALKSRMSIPLAHIQSVIYNPEIAHGWWHGLRLPGSNLPGVLTAGSFYQHKEWAFWDVHNPINTIVITLKDERYQKLVLEVEDPQKTIAELSPLLS